MANESMIRNPQIETDLCTSDFFYELPPERIAQHPMEKRDHSRLMVLDRAGKEAEATAAYEQALRLDQGNANAWNNLAQQHLRNGRYEEALDAAENAAKLNPKLAPAHNALAISSYMLGDMEAYEQHYRRAVSNGSNGERLKAYIASLDAKL